VGGASFEGKLVRSRLLGSVADFVRLFQPGQVRRQKVLQVEGASLPNALEIVVLDYFGG
jgi:hypothetical protein